MNTYSEPPVKTYYVLRENAKYGPYSPAKLKEGVTLGRLSNRDKVWAEGFDSPVPLLSVITEESSGWPLGGVVYATALSRCLAYLIDLMLYMFVLPLFLIPPAVLEYCVVQDLNSVLLSFSVWSNTLIFYAMALYFTLTMSSGRAGTIGMQILRIRSVTVDGKPVGFWRSLANWLLFAISGTFSFLSQPFTERRQGIHDLITGVVIIKVVK